MTTINTVMVQPLTAENVYGILDGLLTYNVTEPAKLMKYIEDNIQDMEPLITVLTMAQVIRDSPSTSMIIKQLSILKHYIAAAPIKQ